MGDVDQTCRECGTEFYGPVTDGRCPDCKRLVPAKR